MQLWAIFVCSILKRNNTAKDLKRLLEKKIPRLIKLKTPIFNKEFYFDNVVGTVCISCTCNFCLQTVLLVFLQ